MWKQRIVRGKTNAYGVKKIVRATYNTVSGASKKGGWWDWVAAVKKRDKGLCVPCNLKGRSVKMKEVHHIRPLSQGGTTTMANLISLCEDCHNRRHKHLFRGRS